ncbi:MAG: class II fructose-bisphosphatase [Deltaproteobacteria bacterium]|nr:class II fructose-bisphosphatase [Deltaproteobacteria bacterium]MBW2415889.1 class II fructose-bisphosphatase [Deltaproteobacteria bacterium]
MDRNMALELVRATEAAALASARLMGRGDETEADQVAVDAMRSALNRIEMKATVVIGEGERDEAPMLYIGESVGTGSGPVIEIALDPLEGTTICATGGPNALSVIAAAEEGGFLHAPDTYMDKLAVGPAARGAIDIDRSPTDNLKSVADALRVPVSELTVVILDRPRHEQLIEEVRANGARIKLIKDGDVSAAIATCSRDNQVDLLMGVGGAPEGVIAAAALRCVGGELQGRLVPRNEQEAQRARDMGVEDVTAKLEMNDLASGDVMFAATGVTSGDFLLGVRYRAEGALTQSVVMRSATGTLRYIDAEHNSRQKPV